MTTIITFLLPFDGGHVVLATTEDWLFRYCSPQILIRCEAVGVLLTEPCPEDDDDAAEAYFDRELAILAEAQEQDWSFPLRDYAKGPADSPLHEQWIGECSSFEIDDEEWADDSDQTGLVVGEYSSNPLY